MSMPRGTVVGRMLRGKCPVCGQEDVAFARSGQVHPGHAKNSQRHQEAQARKEQRERVQEANR
jgi:hypothetical protein